VYRALICKWCNCMGLAF